MDSQSAERFLWGFFLGAALCTMGFLLATTGAALTMLDLPKPIILGLIGWACILMACAVFVLGAVVCYGTVQWANHRAGCGWLLNLGNQLGGRLSEVDKAAVGNLKDWCRRYERFIVLIFFGVAVILLFAGTLWPRYVDVEHVPARGEEITAPMTRHKQVGLQWQDFAVAMGGLVMGLVVARALNLPNARTGWVWWFVTYGILFAGLSIAGLLAYYGLIPWTLDLDGLIKFALLFLTAGIALLGATIPKLLSAEPSHSQDDVE